MYELVIMEKKTTRPKKKTVINTDKDLIPVLKPISDSDKEHGLVICLDDANQLLSASVIAIGTKREWLIDIQELLKVAIVNNAASYVFAHNHPTGNLKPSKADKQLFKRLKKCSRYTGIKICDSVIVHKNKAYGMRYKQTFIDR